MTRGHGKKRAKFYGCSYNYKRGATVCPNRVQIRQDLLDHAVLKAIDDVLDQRIVEAAVEQALERLLTGQERHRDRRIQIERELISIDQRVQRGLDLLLGRRVPAEDLKTKLAAEQDRKGLLRAELDSLNVRARLGSLDAAEIKRHLAQRAADVRGLLFRQIPQARQMLRKLLVDR